MPEPVLDACCGSRMMWFDKNDPRAHFMDIREEEHTLKDASSTGGSRQLVIAPDQVADFRNMPFPDDTFHHVVFDPPHLERNGRESWMGRKYGTLTKNWKEDLRQGFAECFRVLRPGGTLIFKWCEVDIQLRHVLALTDQKPLYGHRSGKHSNTHWVAFLKPLTARKTVEQEESNGL